MLITQAQQFTANLFHLLLSTPKPQIILKEN